MLITVASEAIEKGGGARFIRILEKKIMVMVRLCLTLLLKKGGLSPLPLVPTPMETV